MKIRVFNKLIKEFREEIVMKMKKFLAAMAALAMATVPTMAVNAKITNCNNGESYSVPISELLPEGCTGADIKYVGFKFSCPDYDSNVGCNGGIVFNTGSGDDKRWDSKKWSNEYDTQGYDYTYPADGSDFTIIRPVEDDTFSRESLDYAEIWVQHWWPGETADKVYDITVEEIYLMDENQQRLVAKAPEATEPPVTEATTPAPEETDATTASTTKAAAAATTKANPTTGESNTGVALAVTAAMAAAGVAVTFGKKKK